MRVCSSGSGASVTEALWDVEQLSEFLNVPVRTVRDWRYRKVGPPAYRIGSLVRWSPAEVRRWLEAQRGEDAPALRVVNRR